MITEWDESTVRGKGNWGAYLEQETGVHGNQRLTYLAYLIIDEAQESSLWADLFKRLECHVSQYILLFTSDGSPGWGFVGFSEKKHTKTPLIFAAEKQKSL